MSKVAKILFGILALATLSGCDVHEFPTQPQGDNRMDVYLNLDFNQELPPYKEIIYENNSSRALMAEELDLRYVVNIHRSANGSDFSREADSTVIINKHEIEQLNHEIHLRLKPGYYRFMVWADYVEHGSQLDRYYTTDNFSEITLATKEHQANDDFRDAFRGDQTALVADGTTRVVDVEMSRPMAKYKFVATDFDEFLSRAIAQARQDAAASGTDPEKVHINLDDYNVVLRYTGFMPHIYNMFTDKPSDARTGVFYAGSIKQISDTEAELGFDYVFVNGKEAIVQVSCELYNKENQRLSASGMINVPIKRSMLTVVRGDFLSSSAGGGIGISPEFDGEFNIIIP